MLAFNFLNILKGVLGMNVKMKALVLAAVAALAVSGTASATMSSTAANANSDLLLTVFDTSTSNSATFDLGLTYSSFASTVSSQNWNLATQNAAFTAAWNSFVAQDANYATNAEWAVTAVADTTSSNNRAFVTTVAASSPSNSIAATQIGNAANAFDLNFVQTLAASNSGTAFASAGGAYYATSSDAANGSQANAYGAAGNLAGTQVVAGDVFGNVMNVERFTHSVTTGTQIQGLSFSLSSTGAASISAVPEADTWAMMLAGFGIVGFVAGRRKSNSFKFA